MPSSTSPAPVLATKIISRLRVTLLIPLGGREGSHADQRAIRRYTAPRASRYVNSPVRTIRTTVFSQDGQRKTRPGAWVNASNVPTSPLRPQLAHSVGAAVISAEKTS